MLHSGDVPLVPGDTVSLWAAAHLASECGNRGARNGERWPAVGFVQCRTRLSGAITGRGRTAASPGNLVPGGIMIKRRSGNSPATTGASFVGTRSSPSLFSSSLIGKYSPTSSGASSKCLLAPSIFHVASPPSSSPSLSFPWQLHVFSSNQAPGTMQ